MTVDETDPGVRYREFREYDDRWLTTAEKASKRERKRRRRERERADNDLVLEQIAAGKTVKGRTSGWKMS